METIAALRAKIEARDATVGIVGMGYVGMPLAVQAARQGFLVLGYDVDAERMHQLNRGSSYIDDVTDAELAPLVAAGRLQGTSDAARLAGCDVLVICVPTPLNATRDPDMRYIVAATEAVAANLRAGQLVVLESTTYPGTTEELMRPRLEASGLRVGEQVFLAFSPERIDPGQTSSKGWSVENTPKVVGGVTEACTMLATAFYGQITTRVVPVSSPRAAEITKLFENIFRNVNIALVNELALLCDRMGLNVWEVIDAAATKPFGFMRFTPGPGLGGHCIPVDPGYLAWKAREYGLRTRFIELAGEINTAMPHHVRELVLRALNRRRLALNGARIALLGIAYKPDVSDYRESPAFEVLRLLEEDGAVVTPIDPHVAEFELPSGARARTMPLSDDLLASCDCAVIITNHTAFDYARIVALAPAIVDTRNATRAVVEGREKIVRL